MSVAGPAAKEARINRIVMRCSALVLVHLGVSAVHGAAHAKLHVTLNDFQRIFVLVVDIAAPILAMILLWTKWRALGAWLLFFSMSGAFLFGVYFHFIFASPDNVSKLAALDGKISFQVTAVLLSILEAAGAGLGVQALRAIRGGEVMELPGE
ncbi:MAG: hypothetical protein ACRD50_05150 [Candidatus Acidiferrales bacterium]